MKHLKKKLSEMPDSVTVVRLFIETKNKYGERHIVEYNMIKTKTNERKNDTD